MILHVYTSTAFLHIWWPEILGNVLMFWANGKCRVESSWGSNFQRFQSKLTLILGLLCGEVLCHVRFSQSWGQKVDHLFLLAVVKCVKSDKLRNWSDWSWASFPHCWRFTWSMINCNNPVKDHGDLICPNWLTGKYQTLDFRVKIMFPIVSSYLFPP